MNNILKVLEGIEANVDLGIKNKVKAALKGYQGTDDDK